MSESNLKAFTKNPQVPREMERLLRVTLEEVARGEVSGLTIVLSRPETREYNGAVTIRHAWEDRVQHIAGLAIAMDAVLRPGDGA